MQLTSAALQKEAGALEKLLPELCPSFLPASVDRDLLALAEEEGDEGCQALLEVLASAGQEAEECSLCGEPGEFAIDPDQRESEAAVLRTTLFFSPRYEERLLLPSKCVLRATGSLIQEVATARPDDGGETGEGLLEHLAEVNDRVGMAGDGNLLGAWGQEVLSRAYALQTASSNIRGWKLANPDGSKYEAGTAGSAANLALQLLLPDLTARQRKEALANALGQQEGVPLSPEKKPKKKRAREARENGVPQALPRPAEKKPNAIGQKRRAAQAEGPVTMKVRQ